ncbi:hypothetical protein NKG05_09920 [Oerskovia sp. M15]
MNTVITFLPSGAGSLLMTASASGGVEGLPTSAPGAEGSSSPHGSSCRSSRQRFACAPVT